MILHSEVIGSEDKIPLVILHGLYGSGESWSRVANLLSDEFRVFLPDLRNHGKSFHHPSHTYPELAKDVKNWAEHINIQSFFLVGHSMGGKTAMFLAAKNPKMIKKMVVADISPKSYTALMDHVESVQFHLNLISMMKTIPVETFTSFKSASAYLSDYDEDIRNIVLKNLVKENAKLRWKINIDAIFNNLPEIMDGLDIDDYIDEKINVPVLFLKGKLSNYLTEKDFKMIDFVFSNAEFEIVENAGHRLHYEQPVDVARKIRNYFLK